MNLYIRTYSTISRYCMFILLSKLTISSDECHFQEVLDILDNIDQITLENNIINNLQGCFQITILEKCHNLKNTIENFSIFLGTFFNCHVKYYNKLEPWYLDRTLKQSLILKNNDLSSIMKIFYIIKAPLLNDTDIIIINENTKISKEICEKTLSCKYFDSYDFKYTFLMISILPNNSTHMFLTNSENIKVKKNEEEYSFTAQFYIPNPLLSLPSKHMYTDNIENVNPTVRSISTKIELYSIIVAIPIVLKTTYTDENISVNKIIIERYNRYDKQLNMTTISKDKNELNIVKFNYISFACAMYSVDLFNDKIFTPMNHIREFIQREIKELEKKTENNDKLIELKKTTQKDILSGILTNENLLVNIFLRKDILEEEFKIKKAQLEKEKQNINKYKISLDRKYDEIENERVLLDNEKENIDQKSKDLEQNKNSLTKEREEVKNIKNNLNKKEILIKKERVLLDNKEKDKDQKSKDLEQNKNSLTKEREEVKNIKNNLNKKEILIKKERVLLDNKEKDKDQKSKDLERDKNNLTKERVEVNNIRDNLNTEKKKLIEEKERVLLDNKEKDIDKKSRDLEQNKNSLTKEREEVNNIRDNLNTEKKLIKKERVLLDNDKNKIDQKSKALERDKNNLTKEREDVNNIRDNLNTEKKKLIEEKKHIEKQDETLRSSQANLNTQISDLEEKAFKYQTDKKNIKWEIDSLRKEKKKTDIQISLLKKRFSKLGRERGHFLYVFIIIVFIFVIIIMGIVAIRYYQRSKARERILIRRLKRGYGKSLIK